MMSEQVVRREEREQKLSAQEVGSLCCTCSGATWTEKQTLSRGQLYQCSSCGTISIKNLVKTPDGQEALFYTTLDEELYRAYFESLRKEQIRFILQSLMPRKGATVVDVGASYGWTVEVGLELGLDAYGVEPGEARSLESIRPRIYRGTLEEFSSSSQKTFDIVNLWHVLEHLPDPAPAVAQLAKLVANGGKAIVAVPTTDGLMYRLGELIYRVTGSSMLLEELYYTHNPNMHFFYYNLPSLQKLLLKAGLVVEKVHLLESFDWRNFYKRFRNPALRLGVRMLGPILHYSRFTSRENLVVVCRKN